MLQEFTRVLASLTWSYGRALSPSSRPTNFAAAAATPATVRRVAGPQMIGGQLLRVIWPAVAWVTPAGESQTSEATLPLSTACADVAPFAHPARHAMIAPAANRSTQPM
jgi:hypothetical protein